DKPWLLRFFDQVKLYEVSEAELLQMREDFKAGRLQLRIEEGVLNLKEYNDFLAANQDSIHTFKQTQQANFEAERRRWHAAGLQEYVSEGLDTVDDGEAVSIPEGGCAVESHMPGS
ncbi:hypothetical protein, partial [Acinetobacter sp. ULE_I080]|uniref:hypothetical protein n=1 Tax=Acinetobacter sp. ULE_I080 TaxID=3373074 RepID=UPI003AF7B393